MKQLEMADLSLVIFVDGNISCKHHGAMNMVAKNVWRCISTYTRKTDNNCKAGVVNE